MKLICGFLILTYNCNNRCKWCYASPSGFDSGMMNFEKAKDFLKLMSSVGIKTVGLTGGEPSLYPNIFKLIQFATHLGIDITFYTNGRKLHDIEFVKRLKNAGTSFVNFSVQSGFKHKEYHDNIVGVKGAWEETRKGIDNCFKNNLKINIQTVLTHDNFKIYKEILDEFAYTNALFIFYKEVPIINQNIFNAKVMSNEKTKTIYKKIFIYAKERNIDTYLFSRMPLCWWDNDDKIEHQIQKNIVSHCHIITGKNLIIDVNGKVLPCVHFINMHTMDLIVNGKVISKERFLKEFNHGTPNKVRKNIRYVPHKYCVNCKYFGKRCTGGCPLIKFEIGPFAHKYQR